MLFVCIFCPSLCVSFFNIRQFQGAQEKAPNNSKVVFLSAQARNRSLKFVSLRIILLILIISLFSKLNRGSKQSVYPHVPSIKQIHFSFVFVFLHAALSPFFFNLPFLILSRSQQTAHTQPFPSQKYRLSSLKSIASYVFTSICSMNSSLQNSQLG